MGGERYFMREIVPFTALFMAECTDVGLSTIFKAATTKGLDYHVFMVYTYAMSTLIAIPLSYLFHRKAELPPFTISILTQTFLIGIVGFTAQMLGYKGIEFASPTLASAMSNLTPACTFILAIIFRMEEVNIRRFKSQAKIIGTVVSISGALAVIFYKGPIIIKSSTGTPLSSVNLSYGAQSQWVIGGALLAAQYVVVSVWYTCQAKVLNEYPAELTILIFYNLFCTIISIPVCFVQVPDLSAWKLKADIGLAAVLYSAFIGSFGTIVHTWGIHVKGPVYVALFKPLSIAVAAIMGVILLGDALYLGSIIGAIVISTGFYVVVWSKSEEDCNQLNSPYYTERVPLLQTDDVVLARDGQQDATA